MYNTKDTPETPFAFEEPLYVSAREDVVSARVRQITDVDAYVHSGLPDTLMTELTLEGATSMVCVDFDRNKNSSVLITLNSTNFFLPLSLAKRLAQLILETTFVQSICDGAPAAPKLEATHEL